MADAAAKTLILGECDDYHRYEIVGFDLDKAAEHVVVHKYRGEILEPEIVASWYRENGTAIREAAGAPARA